MTYEIDTMKDQNNELMQTVDQRVEQLDDSIDSKILQKLAKVTSDMEEILKNKQREKSDLHHFNIKMVKGLETLTQNVKDVNESIESICTITLCLMESQCMQIRAEEQDDEDKKKISLMGAQKGQAAAGVNQSKNASPTAATNERLQTSLNMDMIQSFQNSNTTTERSPRGILGQSTDRNVNQVTSGDTTRDFPERVQA